MESKVIWVALGFLFSKGGRFSSAFVACSNWYILFVELLSVRYLSILSNANQYTVSQPRYTYYKHPYINNPLLYNIVIDGIMLNINTTIFQVQKQPPVHLTVLK